MSTAHPRMTTGAEGVVRGGLVAIDEMAGMSALALGVRPRCVFASLGDATAADLLREAAVEVRSSPLFSLPGTEELNELAPDTIVGTGAASPYGKRHRSWSTGARTLVFDIEQPWATTISTTAAALGAEAAGRNLIAALEELLTGVREAAQGRSLSYLAHTSKPFTLPPHVPAASLIADAGFVRPEAQQAESSSWSTTVDLDDLATHDAEVIVIPEGQGSSAAPITNHRGFRELSGTVVHPSARQWFGNSPLSFWVIATDLLRISQGRTDVIAEAEVPALWDCVRKVI